ncbi:hypothetical protein K461DRAFT_310538 [Myriangium duriaei CBS 260.36]|uniref:Cytochrome b561 domain-containing protein n=1 Tax=Myriangium duriaei CBS 260.36 TaxID=1168546 RepID=A0A9P4J5W4_9PEZI|nr:hypothetical protein K461DRAFT_310538 [Myriangium duriaei CBS 260.36]
MSTDQLSAPGSSQYSSNTLHVGDGTWDSSRDTFLLPNLVGFNLATTQYNGMGNRFRDLLPYHSLIKAHGAIACIVFLLLIPTSIITVRFYQRRRRTAIRIHIWLQILVVFLITVVLILGWFAVGPERSLSNPHHAIGVALYTLVLVQVLGGALMRRLERRKDRDYIPVKVMFHHWMGRAIAILGLAQIPLGLALYGAAKGFFITYALILAAWIVVYFVLSHRYQSERFTGSDFRESYVSRQSGPGNVEVIQERREKSGGHALRDTALIGGALASLAALRDRARRKRDRNETIIHEDMTEASAPYSQHHSHRHSVTDASGAYSQHPSRRHSGSFIEEEKYTAPRPGPSHTWRDRILGAGAGLAAFQGVKRLFGDRRERDEESNIGGYSRPPLGDNSSVSHADVSRIHSGQAPYSPADRRRTRRHAPSAYESSLGSPSRVGPPRSDRLTSEYESPLSSPSRPMRAPRPSRLRPRRSGSFSSVSSHESITSPPMAKPAGGLTKGQGLAATIAGFTGLAYLREKQKQRRERREERRAEEIRRYDEEIADRVNRTQRHRPDYGDSVVDEDLVGSNPALSRHNLPNTNIPPLPASAAAPHSIVTDEAHSSVHTRPTGQPGYPIDDTSIPIPTGPGPSSGARYPEANGSRVRFEDEMLPAAAAGGAAALAAGALAEEKRRRAERRSSSARRDNESSTTSGEPPVSVKVKIHDDNRHVTLRRLNESEAAAERDARRRERRTRRRPRTESLSSDLSDTGDVQGYRRAHQAPIKNIPMPTTPARGSHDTLPLPPPVPPPVPMHSSPHGVASPPPLHGAPSVGGYETGTNTGTEMSAFDDNRRRRRAERAAAKARAIEAGNAPPVPMGVGGVRGEYD